MTYTSTQQTEALRLAEILEQYAFKPSLQAAAELRRQHARIVELEAQLSAVDVESLVLQTAETSNDILTMVEALIIQRVTNARDAARYRWLRDNDWHADKDLGPVIRLQLNTLWDVKIDEAMGAKTKQGGHS